MQVIRTEELSKSYDGNVEALRDLCLTVDEGQIFGLLGPNGAGKSTTVRLLNGAIQPTSGSSVVLGMPSGDAGIRGSTSTVSESAQLYEHMSVDRNLRFYGKLYGMKDRDVESRTRELLSQLDIADRKSTRYGSLSTGLKKRVQLVRALLHRPRIMFLDEPTSGLDPESARHVVGLVSELAAQEGTTVLLCTHNLPLAERICTSYGFLRNGRLVWSGTKEKLLEQSATGYSVRIRTDRGTKEFEISSDDQINIEIRRMLEAGEAILEVNRVQPSLEDAYFTLIGENNHEPVAS